MEIHIYKTRAALCRALCEFRSLFLAPLLQYLSLSREIGQAELNRLL